MKPRRLLGILSISRDVIICVAQGPLAIVVAFAMWISITLPAHGREARKFTDQDWVMVGLDRLAIGFLFAFLYGGLIFFVNLAVITEKKRIAFLMAAAWASVIVFVSLVGFFEFISAKTYF